MVDALIKIHLDRYEASGVELIMGLGRFVSPKTIGITFSITENRFWLGTCKDAAVVQQEYRDTPDPSPHGVLHFLPRQYRLVWIVPQADHFFGSESIPRGNRREHFGLANMFRVEKVCGKSESVNAC
jgi:hypothetical protein